MVPPADPANILLEKYKHLEKMLNLSAKTTARAWNNFDAVRTKFSLEGDMIHWLGCAIFVASRTPHLNEPATSHNQNNNVSLTSLLRHCGLSLPHFFNKIKHWVEMENLGKDFERKIVNIQRSFEISGSTFREFHPMFLRIFQSPNDTDITSHRNRKQKFIPCTPSKVFDFCWLLYITIKGNCSDVVTAYHYLLVCCDLVFQNAFLDDRRDLLKHTFEGLPEDFSRMQYTVPQTAPCVIQFICAKPETLPDALYIKAYTSKKLFQPLFESNILQGDAKTFTGIFQPEVFERNFKNITKAYEAFLLDKGDFDERIFLAEFKRQILLSSQQQAILGSDSIFTDTGVFANAGLMNKCPDTPLTNRRFLGPRDPSDPSSAGLAQSQSALAAATHSVARLLALVGGHAALVGRQPGPHEELQIIFAECTQNPQDNINDLIAKINAKFTAAYVGAFDDNVHLQIEKRLHFAATLFYKLLGNMLEHEKSLRVDISPLVQNDIFYECLYACCIEIVMFSYNCQHKFPWILNILEISSFYFVRVIELIVRSKDQLPRDIVKHLNSIEESILSSILWRSDSLIWEAIRKNREIPKFEEIALPGHIVYNSSENHDRKPTNINSGVNAPSAPKSPGPSAVETFQSPNNGTAIVKRPILLKAGQSLLQSTKPNDAAILPKQEINPDNPSVSSLNRPLKSGSLNIIFRKFYNLAGVRMEHLCCKAGITDTALKLKIWTVLEYSVRIHSDLLRDRHLDQLLMCAVYVICRVTRILENIKFTDIIRHYRDQPQATSDIYRKVLISRTESVNPNGSLVVEEENTHDLINFYNNVYVQDMQSFALRFSSGANETTDNLLLSPLPSVKTLMVSPRHQVAKNVYIKAYESPNNNLGSENKSSYVFNRSASKDLSNINEAINSGTSSRKRALTEEFDAPPGFKKRLPARVENLLHERKVQNA